jgi:hypothetical protein
MIDWWTQLTPELKVFYGIGMLSLMLVIVLTNWIGALIYFFVRRSERKRALDPRFVSQRSGPLP